MNKLNELSKSNPDEYNRIMRVYDEQLRLVWFDDAETPIIYDYYDGAKDGYAFLKKSNDFIEHCKKSTHIKLEIPITYVLKNFDVVYEFDIPEPLEWKYTK